MQTCEKGTHFSQHICLVRQKDVMISTRQYDHTRGRHATFKRLCLFLGLSRWNGLGHGSLGRGIENVESVG